MILYLTNYYVFDDNTDYICSHNHKALSSTKWNVAWWYEQISIKGIPIKGYQYCYARIAVKSLI